jgi:2-polyprenyl-3-methyl-5-hydroxy-6-metoxy-1,4-benzoquinol methylase
VDRERFFNQNQAELASFYLADPDNPFQQSGRSSDAARWEKTRRCIADAVRRDGTFLDVGCANGLLLQTLAQWLAESSICIEPFGVDYVPELIDLAAERVPSGRFWVANA